MKNSTKIFTFTGMLFAAATLSHSAHAVCPDFTISLATPASIASECTFYQTYNSATCNCDNNAAGTGSPSVMANPDQTVTPDQTVSPDKTFSAQVNNASDESKAQTLAATKKQTAALQKQKNLKDSKDLKVDSDTACSYSDELDNAGKNAGSKSGRLATCDRTTNVVMISAAAGKAADLAGSMITQSNGSKATTAAINSNGNQAEILQQSAALKLKTANLQSDISYVNMAAGAYQGIRALQHSTNNMSVLKADKKALEDDTKYVQQPKVDAATASTDPTVQAAGKAAQAQIDMNSKKLLLYNEALKEQRAYADKALTGAAQSALLATTEQLSATNLKNQAAADAANAALLLNGPGGGGGAAFGFNGNFSNTPAAIPQNGGILGAGGGPVTSAATDSGAPTNGIPGLGTPLNDVAPNNSVAGGPAAGTFGDAPPAAPGGGAGGAPGGGGSTSADNSGSGADPAAKLADSGKVGGSYDGGTGSAMKSGGGGAKLDSGPDLNGMLAQFLPKKEEEVGGKNGILDFGSRNPASSQNESLLGKNANIFQRIHETYQEKNTKGVVGI